MNPLDRLREDELLASQIASIQVTEPRPPKWGSLRHALHPRLAERLEATGRGRLYAHQALAVDAALDGRDVVVVTGTNSGKTLCTHLPAIHACLAEPAARALFLFPTKALAQDQLGKLEELCPPDVWPATYDGDTPKYKRTTIRKGAHIVLTNPDMLHVGILPGHETWAKFLKSLRVIVIDEMHVYRGVFGSHVGNVLRRLIRLCEWHRSRPQIIACSATIGNPTELFRKLTGRHAAVVDEDGSPQARRTFVFWNPPTLDDASRASPNLVTSEILATLVENGLTTLAFCRSRITAELVLQYARRRLERGGTPPSSIESYRAGYTAKERRGIERALFSGELKGLAATNAMELGVDIGGLDAVILNGYPGTVSSFWQQAGRAGRGSREGLAIFVAHEDPLEQFLVREPQLVLEAAVESVSANPENPRILAQQLRCAAHERPLAPSELDAFGPHALDVAEALEDEGVLERRGGVFFNPAHEAPAPGVDIRSGGGGTVLLIHNGEELGSMERWRALEHAHEGAVYLHRGISYLVTELDLDTCEAHVVQKDVDYYTQPLTQSILESGERIEEEAWGRHLARWGALRVTDSVEGFRRIAHDGARVLSVESLELPTQSFDTLGIHLSLPEADDPEESMRRAAELHGLEHALMAVAPLLAGCDREDLGSTWYALFPETLAPALFVFDRAPGGVGLCESLWSRRGDWASAARRLLSGCPCRDGCPACLLSPRCPSGNEVLDKQGALRLLAELLEPSA
ncbi:MAG: DEAD/DEAH box helicase [Fimbriimonadaceae bacterium]|nr:DEAD/DEAH box helicase [Fimbriimonadaceae bacterium]